MKNSEDMILPWESSQIQVAVVGDLILDEYLEGEISRISPEAPVPVHLVRNSKESAGGAANVAKNIAMAGGQAIMVGVIGQDYTGRLLLDSLAVPGIDVSHVFQDENLVTTRKTRITANNQQIVRVDREKPAPISQYWQNKLLASLTQIQVEAVVVSDYGKGSLPKTFLKKLMHVLQQRGICVFVDPKGRDFSVYQGAFLVTPNWKESCESLDLDPNQSWDNHHLGSLLQQKHGLENVLITLGEKGMYFLHKDGKQTHYLPAQAREVFDVSGAGDTVVAVLALAMAAGSSINKAMELANLAAGRVVEKHGTQPILKKEIKILLRDRYQSFSSTQGKLVQEDMLLYSLHKLRSEHKKIIFTNGCFDILHAGHVTYLENAKSRGDILVVGINSDRSVQRLKGKSRPIIPLTQRARVLAALQCVDFVISFDQLTPKILIDHLEPDILVKGADYQIDEIVGAERVLQSGGKVERIKFVEGLSTTDIIRKVTQDNS